MTSSTGCLLQSIQILVTGVDEKEKRSLHDIAKSQGAVILSTANANDPPHVVIIRRVGTPRYFTILKRNASIPIVTPEWLTSSIEQGTRLPYADFAAGVFQGLVICFSGLSVPEKKEFSKHVESQGGRHSPVLDHRCTHLVTSSTQSDKFIYAQLHDSIRTITPAWFEESLSVGRYIDPAKYLITKPVSSQHHSQQQNSHLAKQASLQRTGGQQQQQQQQSEKDAAGGSGLTGDRLTDTTLNNNNSNTKEQLKVDATGRSGSEEPSLRRAAVDTTGKGAPGFENNKPSSRLGNTAAAAAGEIDLPIAATPAAGAPPWTSLDHEDDAPLFLESCFVWATCCTAAEEQETLVLCAKGGAKRFLEPHPTLTTHVIVGSNLTGDNASAVALFTSEHKHVPVIGLEWLRRSVARREVLTADERFTVSLPSNLNSTTIAGGGTGRGVGLLGNGGGNGSMSLLGFNSNDSNSLPINKDVNGAAAAGVGGERDDVLNRQNSGTAASLMSGFLDNCYFTLSAVRGTPEGDAAERLIRMHGGRIFSSSVPSSSKACFALCPYSLPSHKVHALRTSHPDFAAVPETQRYTLWWLECCVQAGEVLPCTPGTACFQPLPFVLPLKDMDKVSVSISGYEPSVRSAIQRTVEIIGGRVSLEYMTAKDTHLIVPAAQGKKYKYAARYGVIPVTAAWLLESVKAGKALPPNNFAPLLPKSGVVTETLDVSQQGQHFPPSSSLLPPIGTQQTLPSSSGRAGTSLYAAEMAGPSALNQPLSKGIIATAKPSIRQKAQRLREAAKQRPAPFSNTTTTQPLAAKKAPATSFDFDSLMGPLHKNRGGGGSTGGDNNVNSGHIASAAIASLMGGAGPLPLPPHPTVTNDTDGLPTRTHQANKTNDTAPVGPPSIIPQPETEGAAELDAAMNQVSSLLDRMKGRGGALVGGHGSGHSSQHDMPPPPSRGGGLGVQEDCFGSEGTGIGAGRRGKRSRGGEDSGGGSAIAPRRSTRRGGGGVLSGISELMESEGIEMSQQVGYESAAVEVVEVTAVGKDRHAAAEAAAVAKERLTRAATRNRRGQTNSRDILEGF
jgi:topoisomerase (DNA) II binding protein 1